NFQQRCLGLRDVGARDDLGNVHDGEQGNVGRGHFTWIERPVRNHAINWAEHLRITKLRFCSQEFAFCGFELAGGGFQSLLFADCVQSIKMLLRHFVLVASIGRSTPAWSNSLRGRAPCWYSSWRLS